MEIDSWCTENETPIYIENVPILEFSRKRPFNFSIWQFNKIKAAEPNPSQKSLSQNSFKTEFCLPPNIQEPSLCETINEIYSLSEISERPLSLEERLISCIFKHDVSGLEEIIQGNKNLELNFRDFNGNTPLILAVKLAYSHLDYEKIIKVLIENGADAQIRDINGVSPLEEALAQTLINTNLSRYEVEKNEISGKLKEMPDFYLEIKYTFKIHKIGSSIRLDSNLSDFKLTGRKHRKISLLFHENRLLLLNRTNKMYSDIMQEPDPEELQALIYDLMNPDLKSTNIEIIEISVKETSPAKKKISINGYPATKSEVSARYRRTNIKRKHNYLKCDLPGYLSRTYLENNEQKKRKINHFRQDLNLWVSEKFPLKLKDFEPIIEILSRGNKLIGDLKSFIKKNKNAREDLGGFPVKVQIPINLLVKVAINFRNYKEFQPGIRDSETYRDLFKIPK